MGRVVKEKLSVRSDNNGSVGHSVGVTAGC